MLKTVLERSGFLEAYQAARAGAGAKAEALASVPATIAHVLLDALFERPVQAEVTELLLLPKEDSRFTSSVLVHGMGGTGKTVTAVAVVRETAIRRRFSQIYWLTVGADAVGEKVKQLQAVLHKQISGKGIQAEEKDEQEWQQLLLEAMAVKARSLVVLDDPWMPEQVRSFNPIDGS